MKSSHEFDDDDIFRRLADENDIPAPDPLRKASARQNYLLHAARLRGKRGGARDSGVKSLFMPAFAWLSRWP
jgi:hypothetical protein